MSDINRDDVEKSGVGKALRFGKVSQLPMIFREAGSELNYKSLNVAISAYRTGLTLFYHPVPGGKDWYSGTLEITKKNATRPGPMGLVVPVDSLNFNVVLYATPPPAPARPAAAAKPAAPRPATAPAMRQPPPPAPNNPTIQRPNNPTPPPAFDTTGYTPLYWWAGPGLTLDIWDNFDEDGDAVTVQWNNEAPVRVVLKQAKNMLPFRVESGRINTLTFTIAGEGNVPGNTASVMLHGGQNKAINLQATGKLGQVYKLYFARRD